MKYISNLWRILAPRNEVDCQLFGLHISAGLDGLSPCLMRANSEILIKEAVYSGNSP
jgi:hypothetical protein